MDKLNVLKKISVVAAILCMPLWYLTYTAAIRIFSGDYIGIIPVGPGGTIWIVLGHYCAFGLPVVIALLVLGYCVKRRQAAIVLCVTGLMLFVVTAGFSANVVITTSYGHFEPFAHVGGYPLAQVSIWQGRDVNGDDIWLALEDADDNKFARYQLTRVDCYVEPQHSNFAERYAEVNVAEPDWTYLLCVDDENGDVWRLAVGDEYYILQKNDEEPKMYQSRPIYYEQYDWSVLPNSDLLWDYEHWLEKYAE